VKVFQNLSRTANLSVCMWQDCVSCKPINKAFGIRDYVQFLFLRDSSPLTEAKGPPYCLKKEQ
jgi:hypothetical protein